MTQLPIDLTQTRGRHSRHWDELCARVDASAARVWECIGAVDEIDAELEELLEAAAVGRVHT